MLTPFELMVIFRIQVTDRDLRQRYLAVEAAMEDLAPRLSVDVDTARLAGLGVGMDAQLCVGNAGRRGEMAVELLGTDRAPRTVLDAVASCRRDPPDSLGLLAAGLFATETLVLEAWRLLRGLEPPATGGDDKRSTAAGGGPGDPGEDDRETLDSLEPIDVVARLSRRARIRGDLAAQRFLDCAERLGLAPNELAAQVLTSMRRVRDDLAL